MENPILGMLRKNNTNSVPMLKNLIGAQNPDALFNSLMQNNPQFARFVEENKGRTPEEIARAYGINPSILNKF